MAKRKISKKGKLRLATFGTISIILICYFFYVAISSTYHLIALQNEAQTLEAELNALVKEQQELRQEIKKLDDPSYIASFARENYQYSREGEYIIQINELEKELEALEEDTTDYSLIMIGTFCAIVLGYLFRKKIIENL